MNRELLDKLLLHSLMNYQTLFNELTFHNHNAHHLGSLYLLEANDIQIEKAYENMCEMLDPYETSPHEINISNWRQYFGETHYCKSYRDFFLEQLGTNENDWQKKFIELLLDKPEQPLINGAICGLAHPLIHIGYAFELNSRAVAIEALVMTVVCYEYHHEIIDKLTEPTYPSKSPMEIFKAIRLDEKLPIFTKPTVYNIQTIFKNNLDQVLFYYNQWSFDKENFEKTIEELFDLSVYLYGATHKLNQIDFDFFLLHLLTSMHAIRILRSYITDNKLFQNILQQFFYFAVVVYISQVRPEINVSLIQNYKLADANNNWDYVIERTLNTEIINDAHAVKAIRALRDADKIYGNKNDFYLKTAVKTIERFTEDVKWIGRIYDDRQLNILQCS